MIIRSSGSVSVSDIKRDWFLMTMVWPCSSMTCSPKITGDSSFTGCNSVKPNYVAEEMSRMQFEKSLMTIIIIVIIFASGIVI